MKKTIIFYVNFNIQRQYKVSGTDQEIADKLFKRVRKTEQSLRAAYPTLSHTAGDQIDYSKLAHICEW